MKAQVDAAKSATLQRQLEHVARAFTMRFGRAPCFAAAAPGRVNLIGEHTDYNEGFVLPMAIERRLVVAADLAPIKQSTLWSVDVDETVAVDLTLPLSPMRGSAANHLLGVAKQFADREIYVPNIDLAVSGAVPIGAGLSSSAALEVAVATLLEEITSERLDPLEKAMLCRAAEHEF